MMGHVNNTGKRERRGFRETRPCLQPVETRLLMASLEPVAASSVYSASLTADDVADSTANSAEPLTFSYSKGGYTDDGIYFSRNADVSIGPTQMAFDYGNFTAPSGPTISATGEVALIEKFLVAPNLSEKVGDVAYFQVESQYYNDYPEESTGVASSFSIDLNGPSESYHYSDDQKSPYADDHTSRILRFKVGDTVTLKLSGSMTASGIPNTNFGAQFQVYLENAAPPKPDIALNSAKTSDAKSLNITYTITNNDINNPFEVAVYRSSDPDPAHFDFDTAVRIGTPVTIPRTDKSQNSYLTQGKHQLTLQLSGLIPPDPNHAKPSPYLFVIVNPEDVNHWDGNYIEESDALDDTNNIAAIGTITSVQLQNIMPNANASAMVNALNAAMGEWAIITPKRQAAFLGQLAVESNQFNRWEEGYSLPGQVVQLRKDRPPHATVGKTTLARKMDYFNYWYHNVNGNGNYKSNDGYNFRGRGPIQLTGRNNYKAAQQALGNPSPSVLTNPDQVSDKSHPTIGMRVAAWFWQSNGLNKVADNIDATKPISSKGNSAVVSQITHKVNNAGLQSSARLTYTQTALTVLKK